VLQSRWLVDVERGHVVNDAVVVVKDDRIVAAGSRSTVSVPDGAQRIDLGDMALLPGLIDAHVHLTLGGQPEANARATLLDGFTTVQDLGSINYTALALRDAVRAGRVPGPRIVASGPWLGISGGTCDFSGIGVRGAEAFRNRVRLDVERGADLIKVCVTGWLEEAFRQPSKYEISDDELGAAITEAHRLDRRVAVHALSAGGIQAAVEAGADLVVHGGFTSSATAELMKRRGVYQLSTLFSLGQGGPPAAAAALRAHLGPATRAGLPLAFGTDAGVIPHGSNAREFDALATAGLNAADLIRAATVSAAKAVGMAGQVGTLAPAAFADVIAVAGNPLEDRSALGLVSFVMKGGRVFLGPGKP
jgi:imidazolonepropionase-like amidohydrolase